METDNNWKELFSAIREEEWEEAILSVDNLIKKEPSDPEHFMKLGDLYVNEGVSPAAVSAYKKAVRLYKESGSASKAMLTCKKILAIDPEDKDVQKELTGLLEGRGNDRTVHIRINTTKFDKQGPSQAVPKSKLQAFLLSEKAPEILKEMFNEGPLCQAGDIGTVKFRAGEVIVREGEPGESLFIILRGNAEVSSLIKGSKVLLAGLGEGDIFGEMAFLTAKPRTATVTAATDVELIELNKKLLDMLIEPRPHILKYLYNIYTSRLDMTLGKLKKSGEGLSGNLKELSLSDMLQVFDQSRKEGVLSVMSSEMTGSISFSEGMIMDASIGDIEGEDALTELLLIKEGTFNYEPQRISSGKIAKPVNFVLMECIRLIDEKLALQEYIPSDKDKLLIEDFPSSDDPDLKSVAKALKSGASGMDEIQKAAGLSRIRTSLAVAKLVKNGSIKTKSQK